MWIEHRDALAPHTIFLEHGAWVGSGKIFCVGLGLESWQAALGCRCVREITLNIDQQGLVGAIDFGGTNIRAAVVDCDGAVDGFVTRPTDATDGPDVVIERVVATLYEALERASVSKATLSAVGIGAPGPLDWRRGVIHEAPNLPGWIDVPLVDRVAAATGVTTFLENDANAAALAEFTYGENRAVLNMLYITVSTGVGGGLILDGHLWHGAFGSAGEFGHMTVDLDGPPCDCGNVGCIEAFASGPDMAAWVTSQIESSRPGPLRRVIDSGTTLTGHHVVEAAKGGDTLAVEALARAGRAIGFGIINVAHLVNLELAVVGGGIANAGALLFRPLRVVVDAHLLKSTAPNIRVEPWSLGENVGILGAASAARARLVHL